MLLHIILQFPFNSFTGTAAWDITVACFTWLIYTDSYCNSRSFFYIYGSEIPCCFAFYRALLRVSLKGLSHEIFGPVFRAVWIYLGLNVNRLWFINLNDAPFILDTYFKFWRVSGQTFSEIRRISENDWQLSLRYSNFRRFLVSGSPRNAA